MALFESVILSLIFIALVALLVALIVWIIIFGFQWFGFPLPHPIPKILWAILGLIVLGMIIQLLFSVIRGVTPYHPFRGARSEGPVTYRIVATIPTAPTRHL